MRRDVEVRLWARPHEVHAHRWGILRRDVGAVALALLGQACLRWLGHGPLQQGAHTCRQGLRRLTVG